MFSSANCAWVPIQSPHSVSLPPRWTVRWRHPFAQWPRGLQLELTRTLSAGPESVVLVLERVPQ